MEPHIRLLFVEASATPQYGRQRKTAEALESWFKTQNDSVIYMKSKHISAQLGELFTARQIGQAMKELSHNSDQYDINVSKRSDNSNATLWQIEG